MTTKINLATNEEVLRYYEIMAHTKKDTYIEEITIDPRDNMNGCPRNVIQVKMESFIVWYEGDVNKIEFRQKVKKELPELEEKFKKIKDKYYSPEEVTKRELIEFKERYLKKISLRNPLGKSNQKLFDNSIKWDFLDCPKWDFQKRKRYVEFHDTKNKNVKSMALTNHRNNTNHRHNTSYISSFTITTTTTISLSR
jgi:hypothetical protein